MEEDRDSEVESIVKPEIRLITKHWEVSQFSDSLLKLKQNLFSFVKRIKKLLSTLNQFNCLIDFAYPFIFLPYYKFKGLYKFALKLN